MFSWFKPKFTLPEGKVALSTVGAVATAIGGVLFVAPQIVPAIVGIAAITNFAVEYKINEKNSEEQNKHFEEILEKLEGIEKTLSEYISYQESENENLKKVLLALSSQVNYIIFMVVIGAFSEYAKFYIDISFATKNISSKVFSWSLCW